MTLTLQLFLIVSAALFCIGLLAALSRRHAIFILIGIEIMLAAANLNFIAFWRFSPEPHQPTGVMIAIFSIAIAAAEAATPDLHPCEQVKTARCGSLMVFENRETKRGRKIPIAVVVVPAIGTDKKEPIFPLAGGPGGSNTDGAKDIVSDPTGTALRQGHDIVLVDQRGTGSSNLIQCPPPSTPQVYFGHIENDPQRRRVCAAHRLRRRGGSRRPRQHRRAERERGGPVLGHVRERSRATAIRARAAQLGARGHRLQPQARPPVDERA